MLKTLRRKCEALFAAFAAFCTALCGQAFADIPPWPDDEPLPGDDGCSLLLPLLLAFVVLVIAAALVVYLVRKGKKERKE